MVQGIRERVKTMSYRTKINGKQLFGNNEWYEEWGEYLISKGIEIDDEGLYEGELDNFMEALEVIEKITMNIEAERRERKKAGEKFSARVFLIMETFTIVWLMMTNIMKACLIRKLRLLNMGICFFLYSSLKRVKICLSMQALI